MVLMEEHSGSGDFRKIFNSVSEEIREDEERQQTEMFLRLLDDLDARETDDNDRHARDNGDSASNESDSEDDMVHPSNSKHRRRRRRFGREPVHHKEFLKVNITDDDKTKREKQKKEDLRREEMRGKIHTINDLPPDELDLYKLMGLSPPAESSEVNIESGRRLKDGKVIYSAKFPTGTIFDGFDIGSFTIEFEYIIIFIMGVFLIGISIGKLTSSAQHNREMQKLKTMHLKQIESIEHNLVAMRQNTHASTPIYIPIPFAPTNALPHQQPHNVQLPVNFTQIS